MKVSKTKFSEHVTKAFVDGLVNEVVFGSRFDFAVVDETKAVLSICTEGLAEHDLGELGVFNLATFKSMIDYACTEMFRNQDNLELTRDENKLVFEDGKNNLRFLLVSPKVVSSTVANAGDVVTKLESVSAVSIKVSTSAREQCKKQIVLTNSDYATVTCDGEHVLMSVGKATEHSGRVDFGVAKVNTTFQMRFKTNYIAKVFNVLSSDDVTIEIRPNCPMLIRDGIYTFIIASVQEEG